MEGGGSSVYFRASHALPVQAPQAPGSSVCPQLAERALPMLQGPMPGQLSATSVPQRPLEAWRDSLPCHLAGSFSYSPPLSAALTLLNSETRGSERGLSGQRQALRPGYSLTFLWTAKGC